MFLWVLNAYHNQKSLFSEVYKVLVGGEELIKSKKKPEQKMTLVNMNFTIKKST